MITTVAVAAGIPVESFQPLKELSKFFIVMAMGSHWVSYRYCKIGKERRKTYFIRNGLLGRYYSGNAYHAAFMSMW